MDWLFLAKLIGSVLLWLTVAGLAVGAVWLAWTREWLFSAAYLVMAHIVAIMVCVLMAQMWPA